jgi:hypothetical protein
MRGASERGPAGYSKLRTSGSAQAEEFDIEATVEGTFADTELSRRGLAFETWGPP